MSSNIKKVDELSDKNIKSKGVWVKLSDPNVNFGELALGYCNSVEEYVSELEKRSIADQNIYNKLVSDFMEVYQSGMKLDESPARYSFDIDEGFVIENPLDKQENMHDKQFIRNLCACCFGNGVPEFYVEFNCRNFVSVEQKKRLTVAAKMVEYKLMTALKISGFSDELICMEMERNREKYDRYLITCEPGEMSVKIMDFYTEVKEEEKLREMRLLKSRKTG